MQIFAERIDAVRILVWLFLHFYGVFRKFQNTATRAHYNDAMHLNCRVFHVSLCFVFNKKKKKKLIRINLLLLLLPMASRARYLRLPEFEHVYLETTVYPSTERALTTIIIHVPRSSPALGVQDKRNTFFYFFFSPSALRTRRSVQNKTSITATTTTTTIIMKIVIRNVSRESSRRTCSVIPIRTYVQNRVELGRQTRTRTIDSLYKAVFHHFTPFTFGNPFGTTTCKYFAYVRHGVEGASEIDLVSAKMFPPSFVRSVHF